MAEMMSYDQLVEELGDLTVELMDLHETLEDLIKTGNIMKRVVIFATGASLFWAGMYAREKFFKNKKILIINKDEDVIVGPAS